MNDESRDISEQELQAWVDGQLPPARMQAVEAWLDAHPDEAERLHDYRRQTAQLQDLFAPVAREPVPARLRAAARGDYQRPWRTWAGAAALVLVAALGGWIGRGLVPAETPGVAGPPGLVQAALAAHVVYTPEVRHPVEVGAEQEQHLVNWLSKRLGSQVRAPDLGTQGYQLVGGRLLPGSDGPAAQFMYQDQGGQRLTLYLHQARGNRETAFRYAQEQGIGVFYWIDGDLAYALSAPVERDSLLALATAVYEQLEVAPAAPPAGAL